MLTRATSFVGAGFSADRKLIQSVPADCSPMGFAVPTQENVAVALGSMFSHDPT